MKTSFLISVGCLVCAVLAPGATPDAARILAAAPLRFEPVSGEGAARFVARGSRSRFSMEGSRVWFEARDQSLRLRFLGANPQARLEGTSKLRATTAIYNGNDQAKWRKAIPNYGRIQARELYRGIDLVYYGSGGELEYDLKVKPGADPRQIRLRFDGADTHLDGDGNLVAGLVQKKPVAYQMSANGERTPVESRYRKNRDGSYGFAVGRYDRARELVIDPVLSFSSYVTGGNQDVAIAVGHDNQGFLYVTGTTYSTDLPLTGPSQQTTPGGNMDVFLVKIDPNVAPDSQIVYSTYLGGAVNDSVSAMTVLPSGDVYLVGTTGSGDFPVANAAYSTISGPTTTDAWVAWFDNFQTLVYSTYLGGTANDVGNGIAVGKDGKIWVTGNTKSDDFPSLASLQSTHIGQDAFVAGLDPSKTELSTLIYSTYLGGSDSDNGRGIAIAADGTLWVTGGTFSFDFPVAGSSFQSGYSESGDAFVAHIDPAGGAAGLLYSTYLGGTSVDEAKNVVLDAAGRVIVSGYTLSPDFPVTSNALQRTYGGNSDVFVSILNPKATGAASAQLAYSTYFGGSDAESPFDLKQDPAGNLYLTGFTLSEKLPASRNALQSAYDRSMDAFALKINPSASGAAGLLYFTYLGSDGLQVGYGIDYDAAGNIYLAGRTSGPIFDKLGGAGKSSDPGNVDGFVLVFNPNQ